jgi:hypothetical protein
MPIDNVVNIMSTVVLATAITAAINYKEISNTYNLDNNIKTLDKSIEQIQYSSDNVQEQINFSKNLVDSLSKEEYFFDSDKEVISSFLPLIEAKENKYMVDKNIAQKIEEEEKKQQEKEEKIAKQKEKKENEKIAKEKRIAEKKEKENEEVLEQRISKGKKIDITFSEDLYEMYALKRYTNSEDLSKFELEEITNLIVYLEDAKKDYEQFVPNKDYKKYLDFDQYFWSITNRGDLESKTNREKIIEITSLNSGSMDGKELEIHAKYDQGELASISTHYVSQEKIGKIQFNGKEIDVDELDEEIEKYFNK